MIELYDISDCREDIVHLLNMIICEMPLVSNLTDECVLERLAQLIAMFESHFDSGLNINFTELSQSSREHIENVIREWLCIFYNAKILISKLQFITEQEIGYAALMILTVLYKVRMSLPDIQAYFEDDDYFSEFEERLDDVMRFDKLLEIMQRELMNFKKIAGHYKAKAEEFEVQLEKLQNQVEMNQNQIIASARPERRPSQDVYVQCTFDTNGVELVNGSKMNNVTKKSAQKKRKNSQHDNNCISNDSVEEVMCGMQDCHQTFRSREELKKHVQSDHLSKSYPYALPQANDAIDNRILVCDHDYGTFEEKPSRASEKQNGIKREKRKKSIENTDYSSHIPDLSKVKIEKADDTANF